MSEKNIELDSAIITEPGCEKFGKTELEKRFSIEGNELKTSCVKFKANREKIVEILYSSQTAKRVLIILAEGDFDGTLEGLKSEIQTKISKEKINSYLHDHTFRIDCDRIGEHEFNSVLAEQGTGIILEKILDDTTRVNLDNPEINLYLEIREKSYVLGIDLAGRDLSKRQYRVFNNPKNIKGTIAFSFLLFLGYEKNKIFIDSFALSGVIPIESAIYSSGKSVNFYDKNMSIEKLKLFSEIDVQEIIKKIDDKITKPKSTPTISSFDASFNNVSAQKKNAKIAGVEKYIKFSRTDGEKVDLKLPEDSVDVLGTLIIEPSKHVSEKKAKRIYDEFFENISNVIKKEGTIGFIVREPEHIEEATKNSGLILEDKTEVHQGKQKMYFVKYKKQTGG